MILLKQPLLNSEYYLNKIAADIASRAQFVQERKCYQLTGRWGNHRAHFTTLALIIKQTFLDYFYNGRKEYAPLEIIGIVDKIATLSGYGRDKERVNYYFPSTIYYWSWAFVKALARVAERSEDIKMATSLWRRHEDGSASLIYDRWFLLEASDCHDTWSRSDCGVVEKWYAQEDEEYHYFPYKVFPTENEARLFIAELIMKINSPWYSFLKNAVDDICDEMAQVYVNDDKTVTEELDRRKAEEEAGGDYCFHRLHVYIMNFTDGVQKIGFATNPVSRTRKKETEAGRIARDVCATDIMPEKEARRIEAACYADLAKYRIGRSEFFTCTNEQARAVLEEYSPITFQKKFIL